MSRYDVDVFVLGAGAAGLTAAGTAATMGARTLMVDRHRAGGDCTWTGCIPSKTLLHAADGRARAAAFARDFAAAGAAVPDADGARVFEHVRAVREAVYEHADAPPVFEAMGVEVVQAGARLAGPHEAVLAPDDGPERRLTFRMAVLCSGGRPAVPPVPGLDGVPFLTSETLFELTDLPRHLVVLGGGPIGCEMAQAFRRLGSEVTLVDRGDRLLPRDDADHAAILQASLAREGVRLLLGADVERAETTADGVRLHVDGAAVDGSHVLVATGRQPNVDGLGLDAASVAFTHKGIRVDDRCRTSQRHIWAAGDCTGEWALTHMSEHMAKTAVTNAVLGVPARLDRRGITWTTFTSPEVAQVGPTEADLRADGAAFETYAFPFDKLDRAITDGATEGHVKLFARRWTGKILGASVVGERAGEIAAVFAVARRGGVSASTLSSTIVAYPTYGLAARRAADQWFVRKAFPRAVGVLRRARRFRGTLPPPPSPDRVV